MPFVEKAFDVLAQVEVTASHVKKFPDHGCDVGHVRPSNNVFAFNNNSPNLSWCALNLMFFTGSCGGGWGVDWGSGLGHLSS